MSPLWTLLSATCWARRPRRGAGGAPAAVASGGLPPHLDERALTREVTHRAFVLVRNDNRILPLAPESAGSAAVIGTAARDARVLGGGSAQVFPDGIVSPLEGLRAALPDDVEVTYAVGANPSEELAVADGGFDLRAVVRSADGRFLGEEHLPNGSVQWHGDFPEGVHYDELHTVELTGTFTPRESGPHSFGTKGLGRFELTIGGTTVFDATQSTVSDDPFEALFDGPVVRGQAELTMGEPVDVSLICTVDKSATPLPMDSVGFALAYGEPERDPDVLLDEAVTTAAGADTAIVVVATTERVESEGFDRTNLRLPGRQDELVRRVAAANPRTIVVVNSGSPVEMPWREDVAAVLLTWFPGQEAGAALADVLLGVDEPGGRLPTTWPTRLSEAPVTQVTPTDGELTYDEDIFIGYRAWQKNGTAPAYCFGHGYGYTDWEYETATYAPSGSGDHLGTLTVRVRNTGDRPGREVVQVYLAPPSEDETVRPERILAGFASVEANPGEAVEAAITLPRRTVEIWDQQGHEWRSIRGTYTAETGRSIDDLLLRTEVAV